MWRRRSAALLMEESGLHLEHPAAATFRAHVLAGDWGKADHELRALQTLLQADAQLEPSALAVRILLVLDKHIRTSLIVFTPQPLYRNESYTTDTQS